MTDDKETGWAKIRIRQSAEELLKYGPSLQISLRVPGTITVVSALALIDTGSSGTIIAPDIAKQLGLEPIDYGIAVEPGRPGLQAPYFRIELEFPGGLQFEHDVAGVYLSPPHHALIGRDILDRARLAIDFVHGVTCLQFRTDDET